MLKECLVASTVLLMIGGALPCPMPSAVAHDVRSHGPGTTPPPGAQEAAKKPVPRRLDEAEQRNYFTDTVLLDQDGRAVRFYTDVLKGRLVLISFIYTSCTDICPLLMRNLSDAQGRLGDIFGKDVFFVSISVDPEDDTPEELKKYAERYETKPGWTFLTGKKEDVDRVVRRLGQYVPDFEEHSMLFLLGDVKNGRWAKLAGDSAPENVTVRIRELLWRRETGGESVRPAPP
jgi:cytochrome oxidase Cu insertion factor (SCO1/SenC/PrrC family)